VGNKCISLKIGLQAIEECYEFIDRHLIHKRLTYHTTHNPFFFVCVCDRNGETLSSMSHVVGFRLLPQTSSRTVTLGQERSPIELAHRNCVVTKQQAGKRGAFRVRGLGFRECVRSRRSVVTNVAAPDQMRGTTSTPPYERIRECLVYPSLDPSGRTKGLIHFLGGAFIGAAPDVIYKYHTFTMPCPSFFLHMINCKVLRVWVLLLFPSLEWIF